jgi:hypothetical protein
MLKSNASTTGNKAQESNLLQVLDGNVPIALIQMRMICQEMSLKILMRRDKSISCAVTCGLPSSDEVLLSKK